MKRRCCVGKNVCARKVVKLFFALFFSATSFFSQIENTGADFPLFAVERFATTRGNDKIEVFNIDNRPPYDLIFYGNGKNEFTYHSFAKLSRAKRKFFFFPLSEIKQIKYAKTPDKRFYIFASRKKNLVGVASFTEYGTLRLLNKRKLADYPDKILVGNFLGNPELRALVFGGTFEGVSLFSLDNFKLEEEKPITSGSYSEGGLLDMDADGMNDLVLYNALNGNTYYYLNLLNRFEITYSERAPLEIGKLKTVDIDGDKLIDYAYVSDGKIVANIVRSNPKDKLVLAFDAPDCSDYEFSDFTFDFKKDLIWADKNGDLFYRVKKRENEFTPPFFLKNVRGVSALGTVWNKDRREIIALSKNGFFEKFSPINKIDTSVALLLPDLRKNSAPLVFARKNKIVTIWLSETCPRIYSVEFYSSGKIRKSMRSLPFKPYDIYGSDKGIFLAEKKDSLIILRTATDATEKVCEIPQKKIRAPGKPFAERGNLRLIRFPDTLKIDFEFDGFVTSDQNEFVFTDSANVIFARLGENGTIFAYKKRDGDARAKIFSLKNLRTNKIGAVEAGNGKLKIVFADSSVTFRTNYNFGTKRNLRFYIDKGETTKILAVNENDFIYYTAEIKNSRYLSFEKKHLKKNFVVSEIIKIRSEIFLVGFDKKKRTVEFAQIDW